MIDPWPLYWNKKGEPIGVLEWARLFDDHDYQIVAQSQVGPYWVSTIWLGINHNWLNRMPPIIFETMVFGIQRDDPALETLGPGMDQRRYATEEQAKAGHDEMVLLIEATVDTEVPSEEHENGDVS